MPNKNRDFSMKLFSRFGTVAEDSRSDIKLDTGKFLSSEETMERSHPAHVGNQESQRPRNAAGGLTGVSRRHFLAESASIGAIFVCGLLPARGEEERPVKVGFILPQEGRLAAEAASLMAGFEFFMMEKGVNAPPLDLLKRDSGPKDEKTLEALAELVMNKEVQFLIGPPSLGGAEKAVHAVAGSNVVLFVTNPSVRLVAGELCLPGSFRLCSNTYQAAQPLAAWAIKTYGAKVFITGEDDTQGNEEADFFAYGFEKAGGTFGDRMMFTTGSHKMDDLLDAVRKIAPDFVFASFRQDSAVEFLKALRSATPSLPQSLIGPESLTAFPHTLALAGRTAAGVTTSSTMVNPVEFARRVKEKIGREVAFAERAAEGYDIAHVIFRVAQETGLRGNNAPKTIKAIEEIDIQGPRGRIQFDKNHEPILEVMVQQWEADEGDPTRKVLEKLGPCRTPDFGCGRVGFPKRPENEKKDDAEPLWEEKDE